MIPVTDEIGEDAGKQRLFDKPRQNVFFRAPGPEQRGEGHVDDDERAGKIRRFAVQQTKAAVDIVGEDREKPVDDADAAHGLAVRRRLGDSFLRGVFEKTRPVLLPCLQARLVLQRLVAKMTTPAQLRFQRPFNNRRRRNACNAQRPGIVVENKDESKKGDEERAGERDAPANLDGLSFVHRLNIRMSEG